MAAPPRLAITSPTNGSVTNSQTPTFKGTTGRPNSGEEPEPPFEPVMLEIYPRGSVEGTPIQKLERPEFFGQWEITAKSLVPGIYTALAKQSGEESSPVTFTVDTTPPSVTLTYPPNGSSTSSGSQLVEGTASEAALPTITIALFSGSTTESHAYLETLAVQASNGHWSATFGGLSPGTYTARAEQSDEFGNIGRSAPATFTVSAPLSALPVSPARPSGGSRPLRRPAKASRWCRIRLKSRAQSPLSPGLSGPPGRSRREVRC